MIDWGRRDQAHGKAECEEGGAVGVEVSGNGNGGSGKEIEAEEVRQRGGESGDMGRERECEVRDHRVLFCMRFNACSFLVFGTIHRTLFIGAQRDDRAMWFAWNQVWFICLCIRWCMCACVCLWFGP